MYLLWKFYNTNILINVVLYHRNSEKLKIWKLHYFTFNEN